MAKKENPGNKGKNENPPKKDEKVPPIIPVPVVISPKSCKKHECGCGKHKKNPKVLFLLKKRHSYGAVYCHVSFGLKTSCQKVAEALELNGIETKIVEIVDTNSIDKEVHDFRPTHCILEALFAQSDKLPAIFKLHPKVKFEVRVHSLTPFLTSTEANAIKFLQEYNELSAEFPQFRISCNNLEFAKEMKYSLGMDLDYLPNIFLYSNLPFRRKENSRIIKIGCFSALRPLKNIGISAEAAIGFCEKQGKVCHFYINFDRIENGQAVLKNLRSLFANSEHKLIECPWVEYKDHLEIMAQMDLNMQVSLSETFNLSASSSVALNIPVIVSPEISFVASPYQANPTRIESIISKLEFAYLTRNLNLQIVNKFLLNAHNKKAISVWLDFLR